MLSALHALLLWYFTNLESEQLLRYCQPNFNATSMQSGYPLSESKTFQYIHKPFHCTLILGLSQTESADWESTHFVPSDRSALNESVLYHHSTTQEDIRESASHGCVLVPLHHETTPLFCNKGVLCHAQG